MVKHCGRAFILFSCLCLFAYSSTSVMFLMVFLAIIFHEFVLYYDFTVWIYISCMF